MEEHTSQSEEQGFKGSVGNTLKKARLDAGLRLPQISKELCIGEDYLKALERDDYAALPALTYASGFLRTYATHLGLDPDVLVPTFQSRAGKETTIEDLESGGVNVQFEQRTPSSKILIGSLVLAVFFIFVWYVLTKKKRPEVEAVSKISEEVMDVVPQENNDLFAENSVDVSKGDGENLKRGQEEYVPSQKQDKAIGADPLQKHSKSIGAVGTDPQGSGTGTSQESFGMATASVLKKISENQEVVDPELSSFPSQNSSGQIISQGQKAPQKQNIQATSPERLPPFEIKAVASSSTWLELRDAAGKVLKSRLLDKGDEVILPIDEGAYLTTGNAGGVYIVVSPDVSFGLGAEGQVRRNIELSSDNIERLKKSRRASAA